jgi:hypothetical protein
MALFSNIYFHTFIGRGIVFPVGPILQTIITKLSPEQQIEVYSSLKEYLVGQRIIKN